MNDPIRRLSVVALFLFLSLMGMATYIQVLHAGSLNDDPRNVRTLYREYGTYRGPILVDGAAVAESVAVDDPYGYQRQYTNGPVFAPVTGFYSIVYGRTGLEQAQNSLLNGTSDALFWSRLGDLFAGQEQQGASVETTIDGNLQQVAYDALGSYTGAVVALDPSTGAIKAMVSTPSFDPNDLASHDTASVNQSYAALIGDENQPMLNRAIAQLYPPGSTFKLVVTAAALEAGYTPDTKIPAPDVLTLPGSTATIQNYEGESCATDGQGSTTLADALRVSCNTAYAALGMSLQWEGIDRVARSLGFEDSFQIPMTVATSQLPVDPDAPQTAQSSIGQFDVRSTPLQMAMVAAAIANDGVVMKPYLVSTVRDNSLQVIDTTEPSVYSTAFSAQTAQYLTDMMVGVVDDGTGTRAQISGVQVAGKTGTAESGTDAPPYTWFVAFAPADDPKIAIAVLVEDGGTGATGGKVAAPIAQKVLQAALDGGQ
ncbi:penicillin-binding protein 2 [Demequina capsici]|uniref:Penicillin-binding protein 2 n=1 Tax=Demequina capsici TaxID=3075620 RepID=A0AA96J9K9_9MICO|nr:MULTISPECIES: penicillin-binding protein 2 [unclassified Demequina]WNM24535.1 penicillin-binding protein 2 [Demequina sp. OYTSA14]WNM27387.1 penicillin-binding protein 2 [Demequina sp. PMTSA13]